MGNKNQRGVFSISQTTDEQLSSSWPNRVWASSSPSDSNLKLIQGNLDWPTQDGRYSNAYSSSNFGYFGGGYNSDGITNIERLDFSNDNNNTLKRANTEKIRDCGSVTTQTHGYFFGGRYSAPITRSYVRRLDYSSDTYNTLNRGDVTAAYGQGGLSHHAFGYAVAGRTPSDYISGIKRIDFANDGVDAVTKGNVPHPAGVYHFAGCIENQNYGYIAGGQGGPSPSPSFFSTIYRIDFENSTVSFSPKSSFGGTKDTGSANGNLDYGYFSGASAASSVVDRLDYSNDTHVSLNKASWSAGQAVRRDMAATGNASQGYWGSGLSNPAPAPANTFHSNIGRVDYSNDTATINVSNLSTGNLTQMVGFSPVQSLYSKSNSVTFFYADKRNSDGAGNVSAGPVLSDRDSEFDNGTDFSNSYGYYPRDGNALYLAGGSNPGGNTSVLRMDYANSTLVTPQKATLSYKRDRGSVLQSQNSGHWIGGGAGWPDLYSSSDRVDYSNDTVTAGTNFPVGTQNAGSSVGAAGFSYTWCGSEGASPAPNRISSIYRYAFSNDTYTKVCDDIIENFGSTALGNADRGWNAGGWTGPNQTNTASDITRIDYANDTVDAVDKGNLPGEWLGMTSMAGPAYGYFVGGRTALNTGYTISSRCSRFDYATDSVSLSPKGNSLYPSTFTKESSGNFTYGFVNGGTYDASQTSLRKSSIQRLNYFNDTVTMEHKSDISYGSAKDIIATSATGLGQRRLALQDDIWGTITPESETIPGGRFGYIKNGYDSNSPSVNSRVERLEYYNDLVTTVGKTSQIAAQDGYGVISSTTFGYIAGGHDGSSYFSLVHRLSYASDTDDLAVRGNLDEAKRNHSGLCNTSYGYAIGGQFPSGPDEIKSTSSRIDFSSDGSQALPKGKLAVARMNGSGAGTLSYGYVFGGNTGSDNTSLIDRFEYGNDTMASISRSSLDAKNQYSSTVGNADYAYTGGGSPSFSPVTESSKVQRYDYSNDTVASTPKSNLNRELYGLTSTGNHNYGWFCGGRNSADSPTVKVSTIQRIDYANDTTDAIVRGYLSSAGYLGTSMSNMQNGFPTPSPS